MDIRANAAETSFRTEVRDFLDANLTQDLRDNTQRSSMSFATREDSRRWQKILYEKGWIAPYWPIEHGGTGWGDMQRYIYECECALAGTPRLLAMGISMVGPVLMKHGSAELVTYKVKKNALQPAGTPSCLRDSTACLIA